MPATRRTRTNPVLTCIHRQTRQKGYKSPDHGKWPKQEAVGTGNVHQASESTLSPLHRRPRHYSRDTSLPKRFALVQSSITRRRLRASGWSAPASYKRRVRDLLLKHILRYAPFQKRYVMVPPLSKLPNTPLTSATALSAPTYATEPRRASFCAGICDIRSLTTPRTALPVAQTSRPYGMTSSFLLPSGSVTSASMVLSLTLFTAVLV